MKSLPFLSAKILPKARIASTLLAVLVVPPHDGWLVYWVGSSLRKLGNEHVPMGPSEVRFAYDLKNSSVPSLDEICQGRIGTPNIP